MEEKKWDGVTLSSQEDLSVLSAVHFPLGMTVMRFAVFMVTSVLILGVYLYVNHTFYPGYPVITPLAENNYVMAEHYPPFRMDEWSGYSIANDMLEGNLNDPESLSRKHPLGFSFLSMPLTALWGKAGPFYTNVFILWLSALIFFFLMFEMVSFPLAIISTLFLALATPNLFFAASAFSEPAGQVLALLTLLFFIYGLSHGRTSLNSFFCGFAAGLNLFFQPMMAFIIVPVLVLIALEKGRWEWSNHDIHFHVLGFFLPFALFITANRYFTGEFIQFIFTMPYNLYDPSSYHTGDPQTNWLLKIWKILLHNPLGILYLMPVVALVPSGLLAMWRSDRQEAAILSISVILLSFLQTVSSAVPITGESVGARQMIPVLPFLVVPLAFLWEEGRGEKILITALTVLTIYMCSLGWWTGIDRGAGILPGILQDRDARYILLARKGMLQRPVFQSKEAITGQFFRALKDRDIKRWLETLDRATLAEILGNERDIFTALTQKIKFSPNTPANFIESADPASGVRAVIPEINAEPALSPDIEF
jgi:hypothetical protein